MLAPFTTCPTGQLCTYTGLPANLLDTGGVGSGAKVCMFLDSRVVSRQAPEITVVCILYNEYRSNYV